MKEVELKAKNGFVVLFALIVVASLAIACFAA